MIIQLLASAPNRKQVVSYRIHMDCLSTW